MSPRVRFLGSGAIAAPALFFLCLCVPHRALADTRWDAAAYKGWSVTQVKIRGMDKDAASELKRGLALAASTGFLGLKLPVFFPQTLTQDIERSLLFLARRGYPRARVRPDFEPDARREELIVILNVDRGPPVVIASTAIAGMPPALERKAIELLPVRDDSVLVDKTIDQARAFLDSLVTYGGYARATVGADVRWEDSTHAQVRFSVQPGTLYHFGRVTVTGASPDLEPLILKTASIEQGALYSPEVLAEAQKNLQLLGLFRQTRLDLVDAATDTADVAITVGMREPRSFEANLRYWSDEGFSGDARWSNRNIFHRGRGLSIIIQGSILRQLFQVSTWWPAILWPTSKGIFAVGSSRENEDAYESVSSGISISLRHEYSVQSMVQGLVRLTNEEITSKSTDPNAIPDADGNLLALNVAWERYDTDLPIVPTEGTVWRGFVEWAPEGKVSQNHYLMSEMTGITYLPLASRQGFALRLTVGLGAPIGSSTDIIPNKRFYSGGANSMRGFHRRQLGPLDSENAALGGESKMEASFEYRFPLPWRFRGTLFVDTGQVWSELPDLDARRIEAAVGPGLWIETPVGPVRGDVGYRLTDYEASEPRWVFHFSVGPSY